MISPNKILCPLCNSYNYKILYKVDSKNASHHFFPRINQNEEFLKLKQQIEILWGQQNGSFLTCLDCGFCFASPFIAGDNKYYSIAYNQSNLNNIWKFEYEYTYKDLERLIKLKALKENFTLLEIGAGNGMFLTQIGKTLTNYKNIHCTEFSESVIKIINAKGINCYGIDIFGIKTILPEIKFDVICMFQVLEHLQDPKSVFMELNRLIKLNGFLYIAVPNSFHRSFYDSLNYNEDLPPTHISRWNRNNLDNIGTRFGFKFLAFAIENTSYFSKFYKFYNVILKNRAVNIIDNKIQRRLYKILDLFLAFFKSIFYFKSLIKLKNKNLGISSIAMFEKAEDYVG